MTLYNVVKYTGRFGFIKPASALRDVNIISQKFLSFGTVAGIERKLFPELLSMPYEQNRIVRHRLSFQSTSKQLEVIHTREHNRKKRGQEYHLRKNRGRIFRHVLINPVLYLAFSKPEYAQKAAKETLCLCRNEDLVFPEDVFECTPEEFDKLSGFELIRSKENAVYVGYNRYSQQREYGVVKYFEA